MFSSNVSSKIYPTCLVKSQTFATQITAAAIHEVETRSVPEC